MSPYRSITGREFAVAGFSSKERQLLSELVEEYGKSPDWAEFSAFWQSHLKHTLAKLPRKERNRHPLYKIAQDLELRLGIAQGLVAEPDYRDYLVDRIEEKYGSRYRFCKETGIPEAFLSQVLSGKKDFSVENLRRAAKALDLGLALLPTGKVADLPISDSSALRQVCGVVSGELARLESVHDHLRRIKDPAKRGKALSKEASLFHGPLEEVLRETEELPIKQQGERVFEIIERKKSELEGLLSLLRARAAMIADDFKSVERDPAGSLPLI